MAVLVGVVAGSGIAGRAAMRRGEARPAAGPVQAAPAGGAAIVPFTIHVPDAVLVDLKQRLARARFPDEV